MTESRQNLSWWHSLRDLLLVTLLGLPLITPLLRWTSAPCTHDGHLHYHRIAAIGHAWKQGIFFSRWLPDLAFGYGYPFFVFREPLPLYLTHWLHLLGLPLSAAGNLFYILCILAAGWFTYLWVRDVFGAPAGMLAALAYMVTPYQLIDALIRGNQVESLALALMPLLLWSGRRFVVRGTALWFLLATLGLSALALSHNISLFLFTPVLGVYLLAIGWLHHLPLRLLVPRTALIFVLGLGTTSFYTGTALLEMDQVTLEQSVTRRNNDFRNNFTSVEELLAPVAAEDPSLINPLLPFRIGWIPGALAVLGLVSLAWNRQREQRAHLLFLSGAAAFFLLMSLPLAQPIWEAIPLIEFVQFPWRMVGRAGLPIAALAGAPLATGIWQNRRRPAAGGERKGKARSWLPVLLLAGGAVLLLLEAYPLLYPTFCEEKGFPTIADVHSYEAATGMVGVDPAGSYFPRTVRQQPEGSPLVADYLAGRPPQRLDETVLPAGTQFADVVYHPLGVEARVASDVAFEARYLTFDFPGWSATVDGKPVTITPEEPTGLITFAVPAGQHTITVGWQSTPLRSLLGAASLFAFLAILGTAFFIHRLSTAPAGEQAVSINRQAALSLLGVAVVMLGAKVLLVDRVETPLRQAAQPRVTYPTGVSGGELELAGYNLSRQVVPAGEMFDVHLAWQVTAPPAAAYQSNLWLVGPEGAVWSDKETYRPRLYEETAPTLAWAPGQWAWDSREVQVLPGTPPGRYDLVLTLFPLETLQPVTLREAGGASAGPTAVIGQVEVVRPEQPPLFQPQHVLSRQVEGLALLGFNQDREQATPGDPLLLTFFWEKVEAGVADLTLELELEDQDGEVVESWQLPPVRAGYPPEQWAAGERLRAPHLLRLPARLESGRYRLVLEGQRLSSLEVEAPPRTFTRPAVEHPADELFGEHILLSGYSTGQDGDLVPGKPLTVTLLWQGTAELVTSYRVFIHLVDEDGQIIAQSDAEPAGWQRPTTGWAPGEYITDEHHLSLPGTLPAGPLFLRVGLYNPESGQRLPVAETDHVLLSP